MATAVVKGREGVVLEPDGDGSDALVRLSPASDLATITVSSILSLVSIRTSASLGSAGQRANRRSTAALDSYLRDRRQSESNISIEAPGRSSCSQEIDDALDGGIGAVIGGFEPAVWTRLRVLKIHEPRIIRLFEVLLHGGPQIGGKRCLKMKLRQYSIWEMA